MRTPGKQCGLAATGDYQPSLRSPWLAASVEIFFHNKRVTSHVRKYCHGMTTNPEHMPKKHEKHHQWTAGRLMNWAKDLGDEVLIWVKRILAQKQHEQQAYRVCLGLLSLSRKYDPERLNKACAIANKHQLYRVNDHRLKAGGFKLRLKAGHFA